MSREFQRGDIVRIRDWADMEREFGIYDGSIECRFSFTPEMKELCGEQFVISDIGDGRVYGHDFDYSISTDMIEEVRLYHNDSNDDTSEIENYLSKYKNKEM